MDNVRHRQHLKEARHIHTFRFLAYRSRNTFWYHNHIPHDLCSSREPKNRATWLKIWYKNIEDVEKDNPWALAFNEEEEMELRMLWDHLSHSLSKLKSFYLQFLFFSQIEKIVCINQALLPGCTSLTVLSSLKALSASKFPQLDRNWGRWRLDSRPNINLDHEEWMNEGSEVQPSWAFQ